MRQKGWYSHIREGLCAVLTIPISGAKPIQLPVRLLWIAWQPDQKSRARPLIFDLDLGFQLLHETVHDAHPQAFAVVFKGRKIPGGRPFSLLRFRREFGRRHYAP
ncbi:hypothetical protein [Rhizobium sp. F40D2]|uniref:hypothetical protein n=1 Tax=Rhizobium sp. F40D2 TaxID=3453141 RepID=UPI003F299C78